MNKKLYMKWVLELANQQYAGDLRHTLSNISLYSKLEV